MRRPSRRLAPLAIVVAVAGALGVPTYLVAQGGGAASPGPVTIAADERRPVLGERVVLRARFTGGVPDGARIVVVAQRLGPSGAVLRRSLRLCRPGARACLVRARAAVPRRVRYRALLRVGDRVVRASRPLTVAWRRAPAVAPVGGPAAPGAPGAPGQPAPGSPAPCAPSPLPPGLPGDIAGFECWTKLNAAPIPPRSGDPHLGTKEVYANVPRDVARNRPFPPGTIVVKVARRSGVSGYALAAIMRKIAGIDPAHGNWQFVEYLTDGRGGLFTRDDLNDEGCWGCHGIAQGTDWVYTPTD